jgi:hypothetical protein
MNVEIRPDVGTDLATAADWYDQREPGLGDEFMVEYRRTLAATIGNPLERPVVRSDLRWRKLARFPYLLWYRVNNANLVVAGVLHIRRDRSVFDERG